MSELNAKSLIALLATALLVAPVLALDTGEQVNDWPVANPIDSHSTWYNWTLDDAAGYTLDNTSMAGGGLWLAPYAGNFSGNGSALSTEASVTWGSIAVSAVFYWFANTSAGEAIQLNVSWSEDNASWSPEITLGGNGTSVQPAHAFYRWNATFSAVTNLTTPTLWWVGLWVMSNTGPVADAGADFSTTVTAPASLDGSLSGDADLDTLTYLWTQTGGAPTPITNANLVIASIAPLAVGIYTFMLNVTDGSEYATDSVVVTVNNVPPTADAGFDQVTVRNATIYLNGSGSSDADGNPLSYNWSVLSAPEVVTLNNSTTALADFVPMMVGTYSFNLTVMDNESASAYDWIDIFVVNLGPTADAGTTQFVFKNDLVTLDGTASADPDGDPLWYNWTQTMGPQFVTLIGGTTSMPTFTAPTGAFAAGDYGFDLMVWDAWAANSTGSVIVNVSNRGPTANAGLDQNILGKFSLVTLDGSLSADPDAEALTYLWTQIAGPAAPPTAPASVMTDFTAVGVGVYDYNLTATDPDGASSNDTVSFNVTNAAPTAALAVTPNPVLVGAMADVNASASTDVDGSVVLYNFTFGDGSNSGDIAAWAASHSWATPGAYQVNVTIWDDDAATDVATVTVNVVTDLPPTAVAAVLPGTTGDMSTVFSFDATGSTDDNGITAYLWDFGDLTTANTTLATHQYSGRGTLLVTLTVWDVLNQNATDSLSIDVLNRAPTANAGLDQTVAKNVVVILNGSLSADLDPDTLTYQWVQVSGPALVTLTGATSAMATFTPTRAGPYTFNVTVDDGYGVTDTDLVLVTVTNVLPIANAGPDQAGMFKGILITLNGSQSSDADDPVLLFGWTVTSSPGPVTLTGGATAVATFTPTLSGTYVFTLLVDDQDNGTDADPVTVMVWGADPVAVLTSNVTTALVGEAIQFNGSGSTDSDGTIGNWTFDFDDGSSTFGLANVTSHVFTAAGNFTVTLTVTDDEGNTSVATIVVTITAITVDTPPSAVAAVTGSSTGTLATTFSFTSAGSTDDVGITAYLWDFGDASATVATATAMHQYTSRAVFTVTLTVWDVLNQNDSATVAVTVQNLFPTVSANDATVDVNTPVTMRATGSDPDTVDTLAYLWTQVSGATVALTGAATPNASFTPTTAGTYTFNVTVNDGHGGTSTDTVLITVNAPTTPPTPDNTLLIVAVIVVVLVVLVLFALMAARKKKKPAEGEDAGEMEEEEGEDAEEKEADEKEEAEEVSEGEDMESDKDAEEADEA